MYTPGLRRCISWAFERARDDPPVVGVEAVYARNAPFHGRNCENRPYERVADAIGGQELGSAEPLRQGDAVPRVAERARGKLRP